jgi:plasmid stabilization system protein ParE
VPKSLILTEDAQQDLDGAYQWYQEQNLGLGQEFMRCVDAKLSEEAFTKLNNCVILSAGWRIRI